MNTYLVLFAVLAPLLSHAIAVPEAGSLSKRQDGNFNVSFGDTNSFSSDIPLVCATGCIPTLTNFVACTNNTLGLSDADKDMYCNFLCAPGNYTGFTQCLNCVIANGEADVTKADENKKLDQANSVCSSKGLSSTVSEITASPTTTAPTGTTFTESVLTLPTWTGLASFVAAESNDGLGGGSNTSGATKPTGSATGSASGSATSSAAPSASTSGAAMPALNWNGPLTSAGGVLAAVVGLLVI